MPEMIDVLDENGIKTGQIASRDEVHKKGLWHRCIVVAILNDKNEILLQQRSQEKLTHPGKWDLAAAGHVDAGEDALSAAMRETTEEIGINTGVVARLHHITTYQRSSTYEWGGEKMTDRQIFDCFLVKIPEIDPRKFILQSSEVQAVKLVDIKEFKQLIKSGTMMNRQPFYDMLIKIMEES